MTDAENVIERFSNYVCLTDQGNCDRTIPLSISDPIAKQLIEKIIAGQNTSDPVDFWAKRFLKICLTYLDTFLLLYKTVNSEAPIFDQSILLYFCNRFLFLYLQPVCWETAIHLDKKINRFSNRGREFSLEDYFLISCEAALDIKSLFRSFSFASTTPLHTYSRVVMQRKVTNQIVKKVKDKTLKFTGYGLLKNTSPTALEKALLDYGILPKELFKYKLACQSFKDYFSRHSANDVKAETAIAKKNSPKKSKKILVDTQATNAITQRFNSQIQRVKKITSPASDYQISKYLDIAVKAVQGSQSPKTISLDKLMQDTNDIPALSQSDIILQNGWQDEHDHESTDIVLAAFQALDPLGQCSLILWLGLDIKQSDFIKVLAVKKQYQVARTFQRYQREMLREIIRKSSEDFPQAQNSGSDFNTLCKDKLVFIKDYLKVYSKNVLSQKAEYVILNHLELLDRQNLKYWLLNLNIAATVATDLRHEEIVEWVPSPELIQFEDAFKMIITEMAMYHLDELESASIRVRAFLINWLVSNQAIL